MYKHSKMKYLNYEIITLYNQKISYLYRYFTLMVASNTYVLGFFPEDKVTFKKCQ